MSEVKTHEDRVVTGVVEKAGRKHIGLVAPAIKITPPPVEKATLT